MLNHVRTLLLNRAANEVPPGPEFGGLGEEFVPENYQPVELPGGLQAIRQVLFGQNPDRYMLNYRLYQLLTLLHSTELDEHVRLPDPRITYRPGRNRVLLQSSEFRPHVQPAAQTEGALDVSGMPTAPDRDGRLFQQWRVRLISSQTLEATDLQTSMVPGFLRTYSSPALWSADGPGVLLPNSQFRIRLSEAEAGDSWRIHVLRRPQESLGALAYRLRQLPRTALLPVLGAETFEPLLTWRNLWQSHESLPYQLGGLLLLLAYRMDAIRHGHTGPLRENLPGWQNQLPGLIPA
jgi:hypothetical protein